MKKIVMIVLLMVMLGGAVYAQAYDIKEMTPVVKTALEARKGRFAELKMLKTKGVIGETYRGYVEALGGNKEVAQLVEMENRDRRIIYQAIVEQNNLNAGALATVEEVFASVQRDKAAAGEKVQDASGKWTSK